MTRTPPAPLVARIVTPDTEPVARARASVGARLRRHAATVLIGIAVVFVATMGIGGGSPAQAGLLPNPVDGLMDKVCAYHEDPPGSFSSSFDGSLFGSRAPYSGSLAKHSATAYEEYSLIGVRWSQYSPKDENLNADHQSGCVFHNIGNFIENTAADSVFAFTRVITGFTISLYTWATSGDLLSGFTKPLNCIVTGCNQGKGLRDTLFLNYLAPIVMMGALWGAWNGLVKKRTTETAQGGLWMLGATAFALVFMASPGIIAEHTNQFVSDMSTSITNSVTSASSSTIAKQDMCWLDPSAPQRGNRMAACSMFKAMMVTPWSVGQFGVPLSTPLKANKSVNIGNRTSNDMRVVQMESQTISQSEDSSGKSDADIRAADGELWTSIKDQVCGKPCGGTADTKADYMAWSGKDGSARMSIAMTSVFAAFCLGALVVLISFSTVVLALGMILLIMLAPLFLLIGIHPGFGRGIALKWLELLLGTVVKRVVLSAMLAILVGMYQVIMETPMPWLSQIALIMALGVGAIIFRKPMLETLNVINLGGTRTGMENGIHQEAKRGASMAVGAGAGAVTGLMAGGLGSALKGGVKGGITGSRSGSVLRAGSMGAGAGRRVGSRDATKKDSEQRERDEQSAAASKKLQDRLDRDPFDVDAWAEVDRWNRKNPNHKVEAPKSGGSTPYPQSKAEADEWERQRRDRSRNGSPDPAPAPAPTPNGANGSTPPPTGGIPTSPVGGGRHSGSTGNGDSAGAAPRPGSTGGLPTTPPTTPPTNGSAPSGSGSGNPPRPGR